MTIGRLLFIAWCALVLVIFAYATYNASSPFNDGRRGGGAGGVFVGGGGPRHK
ncbi:MAG: hypothetical protein ACOYLS_04705 [Polymorphobacter sp.]